MLTTPATNICFILPAMKFGERIEAALQEMHWGPKELEKKTGVADSTISALTKRGSDRTNYKEQLIKGFPPDQISHEWLRSESGPMKVRGLALNTSQESALVVPPGKRQQWGPLTNDLAEWFDQLPTDHILRLRVFIKCSQIIQDELPDSDATPTRTHTPPSNPTQPDA